MNTLKTRLSYALLVSVLLAGCAARTEIDQPARPDALASPSQADTSSPASSIRAMFPAWYEAATPFRVIGQIYHVGSQGLAIYFIPTAAGHIVIDGGLPENAEMVADAITELGFDPGEIRILLNTHAHFDHSGGLARLKELSGAELIASEGDRSALEGGFYLGSEENLAIGAPPVKVDRIISDGETVSLGDVSLTAHLTPGHTRGCTSWIMEATESDQSYQVLIFCSASVALNRLVGAPQYEGIVHDYRSTFDKTRNWKPDVFLANHAEFFDLQSKRQRQLQGDVLAFVDNQAFAKFIAGMESEFELKLKKQIEALDRQRK